jgi:hypothetical protein
MKQISFEQLRVWPVNPASGLRSVEVSNSLLEDGDNGFADSGISTLGFRPGL